MDWTKAKALLKRMGKAEAERQLLMEEIRREGGMVLRTYREKHKLTQKQFADKFGLNFTYVSHVENGRLPLSFTLAARMSEGLSLHLQRVR